MKAYFTETEKVLLYMGKDKARTSLVKLCVVCNKKSLKFPDLGIYQIIFNVFQMLQLIFRKHMEEFCLLQIHLLVSSQLQLNCFGSMYILSVIWFRK